MMDELNISVINWLEAFDWNRNNAIEDASNRLLSRYLQHWAHLIPIELHRLAASLKTEICTLDGMKGDAFLMPVSGGFRVLVKKGLPIGRYRTSVAHELVHTLFYTDPEKGDPRRILSFSDREEHFCFDVTRRILAPEPHLKAIGVYETDDSEEIFNKLTNMLYLSRPWAARIMLADHSLAKGIAGRWVKTENDWVYEAGSATASPSLSPKKKRELKSLAKNYLVSQRKVISGYKIFSVTEKTNEGSFVLVTIEI